MTFLGHNEMFVLYTMSRYTCITVFEERHNGYVSEG